MLPLGHISSPSCTSQPWNGMTHQAEVIRPACNRSLGECGEPYPALLTSCTSVVEPGVNARTWLLGPFTSTGGYDWWFHDQHLPLNMTDLGTAAAVGSYSITFHNGQPPTAGTPSGTQIGLPPIHNHHSKFTLRELSYDYELPYAQAGSECGGGSVTAPNTPECMLRDFVSLGFMSPLAVGETINHGYLDAVYNDVRPANSTAVTFYINYTFTLLDESFVVARRLRPVSTMVQTHAWKNTTPFSTVDIPAREDSMMAWEGSFDFDGVLLGDPHIMHINTHATRFRSAMIMRGTATELGLNETRFFSPAGCEAIKTSSAGFASNEELIAYLRGRCPRCFDMRRSLLCNATSAFGVDADGVAWGYNPTMNCAAARMPVAQGEAYTMIAFMGPPPSELKATFYDEPANLTYAPSALLRPASFVGASLPLPPRLTSQNDDDTWQVSDACALEDVVLAERVVADAERVRRPPSRHHHRAVARDSG